MQGLWGWAWVGVMCSFLWFEATKQVQARECSYSKWLFLMLLLATVASWYLCLRYSSLLLASLSFLCSAVSSASLSLRLISLSSLCSAVSSACLSLRIVSLSSAWLFFRLISLSSFWSAVSFACLSLRLASHRSRSNCCCGPFVYYTLHGNHSHSLRLGHRRCHCPPIVKICCTTLYMGLTRARPNYVWYCVEFEETATVVISLGWVLLCLHP